MWNYRTTSTITQGRIVLGGGGGGSDLCVGTRFALKQHNSTVLQDIPINVYLLGKHIAADQTFTVSWVSANQISIVWRQSTLIQTLITFLSFEPGAKILHVYFSNMGQEKLWIRILFLILLLKISRINIKIHIFLINILLSHKSRFQSRF